QVALFQKLLHANIASSPDQESLGGFEAGARGAIEPSVLLPHYGAFLSLIEQKAPTALSEAAGQVASLSVHSWIEELGEFWRHGGIDDPPNGSFGQFLPRAFLQPYAEFRAGRTERVPLELTVNLCPLCAARPLLGVLRPEADGGKRFLLCSFCSYEWEF